MREKLLAWYYTYRPPDRFFLQKKRKGVEPIP
jgi:hypothetical protein